MKYIFVLDESVLLFKERSGNSLCDTIDAGPVGDEVMHLFRVDGDTVRAYSGGAWVSLFEEGGEIDFSGAADWLKELKEGGGEV